MKRSVIKLLFSLLLFAGAILLVSRLQIKSNMEDMLPKDSPYLAASQSFDQYFDSQDQVIVVVSNNDSLKTSEFQEEAASWMASLETRLQNEQFVSSILYKIENEDLQDYAWAYMNEEIYDLLTEAITSRDPEHIQETLLSLETDFDETEEDHYLVSEDGNHYMMLLKPVIDQDEFEASRMAFYNGLHDAIDEVTSSQGASSVEVGVTGGAFLQDIESDSIAFQGLDGTLIITLLCILLVVALFFGSLKLPLLSMYPLILGAVLASAAAYLIFGSINMFSVSFAMLLLGLGIDFAVHLMTRYKEERKLGKSLEEALGIAVKSTGSSIIIGALTTAFAFATFSMAKFRAFAQMGIISAVGIGMLCLAMLILIPALITVFDRRYKEPKLLRMPFGWLKKYAHMTIRIGGIVIVAVIVISGMLTGNVLNTEVVTDMSAIYPENLPSLQYTDLLKDQFDYNSNTVSVYFDDMDSLKEGTEAMLELESVMSVTSVLDYLPENQERKLKDIEEIKPMLEMIGIPILDEFVLEEMTWRELPPVIRNMYVGKEDKLLVEIVPAVDLYDKEACDAFMNSIYNITGQQPVGIAIVMNEITDIVIEDMYRISILCMSAIFIIAFIAFRHVKFALLTVGVLSATLYVTLGLLPVFGIDINLFSIASFPLILGIGVDSSIHLIHRLKEDRSRPVSDLVMETGKAIMLTGLTTMIGFGSLGSINHPGMSNFGLVVVVGMAVNLLLTLTVVPIVMNWFMRQIVEIGTQTVSEV